MCGFSVYSDDAVSSKLEREKCIAVCSVVWSSISSEISPPNSHPAVLLLGVVAISGVVALSGLGVVSLIVNTSSVVDL